MKLTKLYPILSFLFILATAWNVLCLSSVIPMNLYQFSLVLVILGNGVNAFITPHAYERAQTQKHVKIKLPFGVFICFGLAWMITYIVCAVYTR